VKGISPDAIERYSLRVTHGMKDFSRRSLSNPICAICPTLKVKSLFMTTPNQVRPVKTSRHSSKSGNLEFRLGVAGFPLSRE
jgi:hypothetical protein